MNILFNLCTKDSRHPRYADVYDAYDSPTPRVNCFCDNCFYGRDALAVQLIETVDALRVLLARCKAELDQSVTHDGMLNGSAMRCARIALEKVQL